MTRNHTFGPTRVINIGGVLIGGGNPVVVQSMTNTDPRDLTATLRQIQALAKVGCEIVRVAVPDEAAARTLPRLVSQSPVPLVADIHFDPRLAILSLEAGVHGLRLNPGNIRSRKALREIISLAGEREVPIRVGVNAGSLPGDLRRKHGGPTADAMVESALEHLSLLEEMNFSAVKVSLKASDVPTTIAAYVRLRALRDYPLHLGITEAGTIFTGLVKSAAGLAILLQQGIGDTIRISLAADPRQEVRAAYALLRALKLRERGVSVVACPTCGRTRINVIKLAETLEKKLLELSAPLTIAVMGCGVNGPGEARKSDLGCVGTSRGVLLYVNGEKAGTVTEDKLLPWLIGQAREMAEEKNKRGGSQPRPPGKGETDGKQTARK